MKPSYARYLAVGVLLVGVALIVWTAVSDPDDDPGFTETASTPTAAPQSESSEAPATTATDAAPTTETAPVAPTTTTTEALEPIPVLGTAFTLSKLDGWLNTDATSLEEIREQNSITVVQFWTFGCRNCKKTLDALGQLHADFRDRGVEVVGVHSPEFAYEANVDNIIEAAAELGVVWPIALDTRKYNFHVWQEGPTAYWPRVYVIDSDNQIRFDRRGDGAHTYRELYETVERLLAET
ncbi:redoxin domain-containing protein [Candidatus Poriferisodalis sp.]|uniref:redoxin domain-containing protein n=1 Tax=Candidatus Poriferisodalis sp. TaxID=3101277 RepID=UPI003B58C186